MFSFQSTAHYHPESFTVDDFQVYEHHRKTIIQARQSLDEKSKDIENVLTNALKDVLVGFATYPNPKITNPLQICYDELMDTQTFTPDSLMMLLKKSKDAFHAAYKFYINSWGFYETTMSYENHIALTMQALNKTNLVTIDIKELESLLATRDKAISSFDASKPKVICADKLQAAFVNALHDILNEAEATTKNVEVIKHIIMQILQSNGQYSNNISESFKNTVQPDGATEQLLKKLHAFCEAHQHNIDVLNQHTFNQHSLVEAKAARNALNRNPEMLFLHYLKNYRPILMSDQQQKDRENMISAYNNLSNALKEKYLDKLDNLLEETFKKHWENYHKQTTIGGIINYFEPLKRAHLVHYLNGKSPTFKNYTIDFNLCQKKYDEMNDIYCICIIDANTPLQKAEATLLRLDQPGNEKLKAAALSDKVLWDAISKTNLPNISSKLAKDLLILQAYCLENMVNEKNGKLDIARLSEINEPITEFYKQLLAIRLSNHPINIQAKEIANIEKEFIKRYQPTVGEAIFKTLFGYNYNLEKKFSFNPQFTMFWMKDKKVNEGEKQDVSLFKRHGLGKN